jgi:stress response protein YsnF
VERVTLNTETIQENREVSDTIRREEIEIEDNTEHPSR